MIIILFFIDAFIIIMIIVIFECSDRATTKYEKCVNM